MKKYISYHNINNLLIIMKKNLLTIRLAGFKLPNQCHNLTRYLNKSSSSRDVITHQYNRPDFVKEKMPSSALRYESHVRRPLHKSMPEIHFVVLTFLTMADRLLLKGFLWGWCCYVMNVEWLPAQTKIFSIESQCTIDTGYKLALIASGNQ